MPRDNLRSFRFSDEVRAALEAAEGKSLNDKFENLVMYCKYERPKVEKQLKDLNKQIGDRRQTLYELKNKVGAADSIISDLNRLKLHAQTLSKRYEDIM